MLEYAGLICLLLGIGAFFALWLITMGNRSKTVEAEVAPADLKASPERLVASGGYSLSPEQKRRAEAAAEPMGAAPLGSCVTPLDSGDTVIGTQAAPAVESRDETANTHIEMANLFFNMGDFDGVLDMCQLILDNPAASEQQLDSARELKARSS